MSMERTGYQKRNSKINETPEDALEWESHFVIRFPEDVAKKVDKIIDNDGPNGNEIAINFDPDNRHVHVQVENDILAGKILDLPCITEVMKTVNKETLYKVTDLSQIIICEHKNVSSQNTNSQRLLELTKSRRDKLFSHPDGLTPPMKSARKRMFRKTKKNKYVDAPDVEKEVRRLLREDLESISSEFILLNKDNDNGNRKNSTTKSLEGGDNLSNL
ncbi:Transcription initiation factor TFIID subunit 7 [Strongyloides ratti]|uniref:Transcription initiation factor TFIID subunit 7 n=1 Tax=Strongyloides ratti TaxID=34506 RepID=A0A090L5K9_STRRB|nr:Transcription initiation factor TFIID subunit 7 [Strongyloides ratti]CEF65081.1 Transcription initiation factor TFIID subunit 7 [Strongyloides ratti]